MSKSIFGSLIQKPVTISIDPVKFYELVALMQKHGDLFKSPSLMEMCAKLDAMCDDIDVQVNSLAKANSAMQSEMRRATRRRNPFEIEEEEDGFDLRNIVSSREGNFLAVMFDVMRTLQAGHRGLRNILLALQPAPLLLRKNAVERPAEILTELDFDKLQEVMLEISMNGDAIGQFVTALATAESARMAVIALGRQLVAQFEQYYAMLNRRHTLEGVKVHVDAVTTDVAIAIFENVDANGEIQDGKNPDQISAYSAHKARIIAEVVKTGVLGEFTRRPAKLIEFITDAVKTLWTIAKAMSEITEPIAENARKIVGSSMRKPLQQLMGSQEFDSALDFLKDLDPQNIVYREKTGLLTAEERYALNFRNETLRQVASRLVAQRSSTDDLIQYVLARKAELRDYYRDENSFYVCRVGSGNAFLGAAPGELEVIPGTRPVVDLHEIIGSGFDDVKDFIRQVETSSKWFELFLATSPSRTADKSNVLLVGPQGCGKSELLRAVGGDKKSIGIFAIGSDFLTCWKGEAEKNPKRLFEAAHKLQKESKKHVHILIDEIDTILNKDSGRDFFGSTNLVTEFQNLMDGVVHYPNLSVWGATNNVERISMPMIRRFSKVVIVGELDLEDRVHLLQHFTDFMPTDGISHADWHRFAAQLEGATGDVIRKVVDYIWRSKMTWFVHNHQQEADTLRENLSKSQGQKFTLADFTDHERAAFKEKLHPFVRVSARDLEESVTLHLENAAIHSEIETAKATYARSKAFLASLRKNGAPQTA